MKRIFFQENSSCNYLNHNFLGDNRAGKNCIIENEDQIYFTYDKMSNKLIAYSDEPLTIINNYLGYKINYQLQDFQCKLSRLSVQKEFVISCQFGGNSIFQEIVTSSKIQERRQKIL